MKTLLIILSILLSSCVKQQQPKNYAFVVPVELQELGCDVNLLVTEFEKIFVIKCTGVTPSEDILLRNIKIISDSIQ